MDDDVAFGPSGTLGLALCPHEDLFELWNLRPYGDLIRFWNTEDDSPRRPLQVLDLLVAGATYTHCSVAMGISVSTVRTHLGKMTVALEGHPTVEMLKELRVRDYALHMQTLQTANSALRRFLTLPDPGRAVPKYGTHARIDTHNMPPV